MTDLEKTCNQSKIKCWSRVLVALPVPVFSLSEGVTWLCKFCIPLQAHGFAFLWCGRCYDIENCCEINVINSFVILLLNACLLVYPSCFLSPKSSNSIHNRLWAQTKYRSIWFLCHWWIEQTYRFDPRINQVDYHKIILWQWISPFSGEWSKNKSFAQIVPCNYFAGAFSKPDTFNDLFFYLAH